MGGAFRTITKIWYSFELFWKAFWRAFSIAYFISFSLIQTSVIRKQRNLQKWIQWSKKRQLKKSSTPQIESHQKQYFYTAIWSWGPTYQLYQYWYYFCLSRSSLSTLDVPSKQGLIISIISSICIEVVSTKNLKWRWAHIKKMNRNLISFFNISWKGWGVRKTVFFSQIDIESKHVCF